MAEELEELGLLGRGGMAEVLRVRERPLLREVALKRIRPDRRDEDAEELLLSEARLMARLDHSQVPPVYGLGEDDLGPFFTMKVVEGATFRDWVLGRDAPPLADLLVVFLKVLDVVAYAHARGVLHCDIKPQNVMIGPFGQVYLMDWGVATPVHRAAERGRVGTPAYMAPEQARGEAMTERSEVFALGALLYMGLSGRAPYGNREVSVALEHAAEARWVDLLDLGLADPPPAALLSVVRRAMAREPERRYGSVAELGEAVRAVLRGGRLLPHRDHPRGTRIITEGEFGTEAFVIVTGRVRVWRDGPNGPETLRELGPGDVFGELALIRNRPRSTSIDAITDVRLRVVDHTLLEEGLGLGSWSGAFVRAIAERAMEMEERLATLTRAAAARPVEGPRLDPGGGETAEATRGSVRARPPEER